MTLVSSLLILVAAGQAAQPTVVPPDASADIVVTGQRVEDARKALEACLARHCPPKDEIARSLAYASQQVIAGDYKAGRRTLLTATDRNGRYASTLPHEVSLLHEANARLAGLNGQVDQERIGIIDSVIALKKGLPDDDPAILIQRLEVGDSLAKQGKLHAALERYRIVGRQAVQAGRTDIEGMAMFREAVLLSAVASTRSIYARDAGKAVEAVQKRSEPAFLPYRNGTRLMAVMLAKEKDRDAQVEQALASFEQQPGESDPVLLYNPPIDMRDAVFGAARGDDKTQWADVGFRIAPDGTVADVYTLRASDHMVPQWLEIATRSLKQRRYAPQPDSPGTAPATSPGVYRVERYSFVSDVVFETGSRLAVRAPQRRVAVVDMTRNRSSGT